MDRGTIYENLALNQWHHVAIVGNQDVIKMYVNGIPTEGGYGHTKYSSWIQHPIYIGTRDMPHYDYGMDGKFYAQDIRISKKAVYTGCFVPPTALFDCNNNVVSTPTPTQTPIAQQDPTPTPTPTSCNVIIDYKFLVSRVCMKIEHIYLLENLIVLILMYLLQQ